MLKSDVNKKESKALVFIEVDMFLYRVTLVEWVQEVDQHL